ncbi:MAG: DNA polymerase domain-containing protein [Candidatus Bathyarchaeia archaeon]|jgi:DNA polymerase-2
MQLSSPRQVKGWLLDAYPSNPGEVTVWVITQSGDRVRLTDKFQPSIYVSAALQGDLEDLAHRLQDNPKISHLDFVYKYAQVTDPEKSRVLQLTLKDCRSIPQLTLEILRLGDYLRYELHNCDIHNDRSYFFSHDVFPLAFVDIKVSKNGLTYTLLDSVESTNYAIPDLRVMRLDVDAVKTGLVNNFEDEIRCIRLKETGKDTVAIDYGDEATKLLQMTYAVKEFDPDIILTRSGDSYLFPYLIHRAAQNDVLDALTLGRDPVAFNRRGSSGRTYFSYGHTFYRAGTMRLYGRIHIDESNTFIVKESGLDGLIEIARTCRVPLHTAARFSIGSSMSSIQAYQAIKDDILLPRNKKIPETFKSALDLLVGDRGGFVYEPRLGLHDAVGELDFSSMYPSLMRKYNISAETVLCKCCPDSPVRVPELGYHICTKRVGMVPKTVDLALTKRLNYKRLRDQTQNQRLKQVYEGRQVALKWILVTCFGYLGFSNSKFGTVDGHIGVCAYARDTFLKASHIAEDSGFEVLHGIVDSLWLKKQDATNQEYDQLCQLITREVGVPINFEGQYKWITFLPSRLHPRVSVLNRYFGVLENGKTKLRGIEIRRRDTPRFIYNAQTEMINVLARADNAEELIQKVPDAIDVLRNYRQKLIDREIPLADLLISRHLSKNPMQYRQHVSQLIAAKQLLEQGVDVQAGNSVRFIFTNAESWRHSRRVVAEQLVGKNLNADTQKYLMLLYASAADLLSFAGYTPKTVCDAVNGYKIEGLSKYF